MRRAEPHGPLDHPPNCYGRLGGGGPRTVHVPKSLSGKAKHATFSRIFSLTSVGPLELRAGSKNHSRTIASVPDAISLIGAFLTRASRTVLSFFMMNCASITAIPFTSLRTGNDPSYFPE